MAALGKRRRVCRHRATGPNSQPLKSSSFMFGDVVSPQVRQIDRRTGESEDLHEDETRVQWKADVKTGGDTI